MKKIALILLLLLLPAVSAVQISMNSNLNQGETLMAQVSGNFVNPIQFSNIFLYQGHIRMPFTPYVLQENGISYIYGQLTGKPKGNYSLTLSGIKYSESGKIQTADVSKNFTILNNSADFSIDPGFVTASPETNFSITVSSLSDNSLNISSHLTDSSGGIISGSEKSTQLLSGETNKIYFSLPAINSSEFNAVLETANTSYQVPVFISYQTNQTNLFEPSFSIQPSDINVSLATSSSTSRYIYVSNNGNISEKISINISEGLRAYVYILNNSFSLLPNETKKVEVDIVSGDSNNVTNGFISVTSGALMRTSLFTLNFSQNYSPANESSGNVSQALFQTCAQLGGIQCTGTSTCTGTTKDTQDGQCCLGACQISSSGNNTGKIIGWIVAVGVIIALAVFLIRRYSKAKKRPINFLNFAKKKTPDKGAK